MADHDKRTSFFDPDFERDFYRRNAFELYAEQTQRPAERKREAATRKRRLTRRINLRARFKERSQLEKLARGLAEEERKTLLEGRFGFEFKGLLDYLDRLTLRDGAELVRLIKTCGWLQIAPKEVRLKALHFINIAVVQARERANLPPFDDWDGPTVFDLVKRELEPST